MATKEMTRYRLSNVPRELTARSREMWLASLGAVVAVEEESTKLFRGLVQRGEELTQEGYAFYNGLVEKGEKVESKRREQLSEAAAEMSVRPQEATRKLEETVSEAMATTLKRVGVLTRAEVRDLSQRVEALSKKVDALVAALEATHEEGETGAEVEVLVYFVTPREEGWAVLREGNERATSVHGTKAEAVEQGRALAREKAPSRLVILRQDGTVQEEVDYDEEV